MSKGFVVSARDGAILNLRVSPGARQTSIEGTYGDDALKLRVATADVSVVRGASSRNNSILVRGTAAEEVRERLSWRLP